MLLAIGKAILGLFTGNLVERAFDVIDRKIVSQSDRERLKADVVKTWLQNRVAMPWYVDFCFIGPLALWWGAICVYSILWHQNGPFPQSWDIAALPAPLDDWAGWIVLSRFGVGVVTGYLKR
jgi:hypothetical protein